ncbi:Isoflavone 2'-hydroxylase [Apostasia shenzhenica]|uniref:Isoflavone 2'-hydroxylase n=1 Tax=Apostasia shenzhenica TaxID=1088818 RepID=A0A2I0APP5_9ASPA|nr:Isoflavone 2'-hydroxylase [Apostasia shenzhenica]
MGAVYIIVTGLALFLPLFLVIKNLFFSGEVTSPEMKLPPIPPSLPILGHLHHLKKPLHKSLARLSAAHGPILLLRFGIRPVLSVSSADLADECFTTNDLAFAGRPLFPSSRLTSYDHTAIPLATYGPDWNDMRRVATVEALSGSRLAFFSDVRAEEARALARSLFGEFSVEGFSKVELRPRLFGLAMNVMMRVIAGKRYYGDKAGEAEAQRFREAVKEALSLAGASNVRDFLPGAIGWIAGRGVKRRLARLHRYRDGFFQGLIDEQRRKRREEEDEGAAEKEEERSHRTVADALLTMQEEQPEKYTDRFIKALFLSLLSGGTDTVSGTVEWAMALLMNNPEKMEKARREIDDEVGSRHGRLVRESDLPNLPYLHCIIKETLRLYPIGPLLPHESLQPCKLGGYDIPRGTMLLVNVYLIQRDPKIWPEPAKFLPERFKEDIVENSYTDEQAAGTMILMKMMLPFGMGRRRCPGEALAMKEVGLVLGTLLQCFEWRRVGEDEVSMEEGSGLTMPRAHPLQAMCKPRECMIRVLSQL